MMMLRDFAANRAIWAMQPEALADLLQQESLSAKLPAGLITLLSGASAAAPRQADPVREGAILVVPLNGPLTPNGSYSGTSTERFADQMREAASDDRVGAIILKIMSPGGLVWGTQEAGDAVFEARQAKPVVAVADKYSFSAAHWIATQASAYYVTPSGQVGSVGVRAGHTDTSGFEEKIGMKTTLIASSPKKVAGHPYGPLSDEDRAEMQAEIDEMAESFNVAIARGRGMKVGEVPSVHGTGEVFSARRAAERGMVDGVLTLREAISKYSTPRARLSLMRQRAALQRQIASI
ncbi:MAG: S49 family peptidase [Rhabdaerophilum sp.]